MSGRNNDHPARMSRRRFLQGSLALGSVAAVELGAASELGNIDAAGAIGPPLAANDRILVVVQLVGGNCGLDTLVPYTNAAYYGMRGAIAVPAGRVLPVGEGLGFHPALTTVKAHFDAGNVAVVRGVGHPDGDLSHFTGTSRVVTGAQGDQPLSTGWLGRYLDGIAANTFAGVAIGTTPTPLLMRTAHAAVTDLPASTGGLFGADGSHNSDQVIFDSMTTMVGANATGSLASAVDVVFSSAVRDARSVNAAYSALPSVAGEIRQFALAAQVINLDLGVRALHLVIAGFDTHSNQLASQERLLGLFDEGVRVFYDSLSPQFTSRVMLLTLSEFGRRPHANGSAGTDHGTSSIAMVIGERVRGGLYGASSPLTALDANGNLVPSTDVRAVYASVLSRWLRADATEIFGRSFEQLDIVEPSPSCASSVANLRAAATSYVPIPPVRILDSRVGNGVARGKIVSRGTVDLAVVGRGLVPTDGVAAVVLNMTVVDPAAGGYLTVWPSGQTRPEASNLNFSRQQTVPNLVIAGVDSSGRVSIYNGGGDCHVLADVCGWFPTSNPYQPIRPARLLDTRHALGVAGKLGPSQSVRLMVAGRGGVPASGVGAVVLNVTGTEPDAIGYLTVWPSDSPRPTASNLNLVPHTTTPNLVIAKLAADGTVSIFNAAGHTHVLADVFGWFPHDAGYHPMVPTRVVDTRIGSGVRGRLRANGAVDVDALCRGAVPVNASAVVLNVTIAEPTRGGYLTVWPAGQPKPNASNLNFVAGQVVPNLVIVQIGIEGMISIYNESGTPHLIADVMGWFE